MLREILEISLPLLIIKSAPYRKIEGPGDLLFHFERQFPPLGRSLNLFVGQLLRGGFNQVMMTESPTLYKLGQRLETKIPIVAHIGHFKLW